MKNAIQFVTALALVVGLAATAFGQTKAAGQTKTKGRNGSSAQAALVAEATRSGNAPARIGGEFAAEDFLIGTGDILAIDVWKEAEISRVVPVRSDGRVSLPLIGELQASGRTTKQLEAEITSKLKEYVNEPEVTVIVQEIKSQKFNVLGMVMRPGSYALTKPLTVVDAIAMAGGFRDFAKQKDVYVLRRNADGKQIRLPFNYKDVIKGHNSEQNVELQSNDTVVVP